MVSIKDMNLEQLESFVNTKNYWISRYEEEESKLSKKIGLIVKRLGNTDIKGLENDIDEVFTIFEGEDPSKQDIIDMLNYEFDNDYLNKFVIDLIDVKIKLKKEFNIVGYAKHIQNQKEESEEKQEVEG